MKWASDQSINRINAGLHNLNSGSVIRVAIRAQWVAQLAAAGNSAATQASGLVVDGLRHPNDGNIVQSISNSCCISRKELVTRMS